MLTFYNFKTVPPHGWRYYCPHTAKWSQGFTGVAEMLAHMRRLYADNNWHDVPTEEVVLEQLCQELLKEGVKDACGETSAVGGFVRAFKSTSAQIIQATRTYADWLMDWLKNGGDRMDMTEVNRRSAICADCPHNVESPGCRRCGGLAKLARGVGEIAQTIGSLQPSTHHDRLKTCDVCGCALQVKIHIPKHVILPHMTETQIANLPDFCWLK